MIPILISAFGCTLLLTLALVPVLRNQAVRRGFVDKPNARKMHRTAVPRIGGVGIFCSFYAALLLIYVLYPSVLESQVYNLGNMFLIAGSLVAFGIGLADDFKGIRARHKLLFQIFAAGLAYMGGVRIENIGFYSLFQIDLGWLSPFVTMFWIVLVINAFNLIDGLDGLAGGVGIIACAFLGYVCALRGNLVGMVFMTAIAGALLGFLRYNFHPASVFMGDGGSYFLGYLLGTISAFLAMSNSATLASMIPMLVVILPIIDVSMATLRRFVHGRGIFTADKQHFHHMLIRMGFSHRNAVIVLYGIALFIGGCALAFLRIKDEKAYVLMLLLAMVILYGIKKLGYFRHYDLKAILPWLHGISDEVGLSLERRSFFDLQMKIASAQTLPELWQRLGEAMEMLGFMTSAIYLQQARRRTKWQYAVPFEGKDERRKVPALHATVAMRQCPPDWHWCNPHQDVDQHTRSLFRVEMDLQSDDGITFGTLLMVKNQALSPVSHYTLKRIEHLKRSLVKALAKILLEKPQKVVVGSEAKQPLPPLAPALIREKGAYEKLKN